MNITQADHLIQELKEIRKLLKVLVIDKSFGGKDPQDNLQDYCTCKNPRMGDWYFKVCAQCGKPRKSEKPKEQVYCNCKKPDVFENFNCNNCGLPVPRAEEVRRE